MASEEPFPAFEIEHSLPGLSMASPCSRRGYGPGLILLMPSDEGLQQHEELAIIDGIPSPLAKWAEESYTVVSIKEAALRANPEDMIKSAVSALESYKKCDPKGDYGLIAYSTTIWELVSSHLGSFPSIVAAVTYGNGADFSLPPESSLPLLLHLSGNPAGQLRNVNNVTVYSYPQANRDFFALPFQKDFHYASESVSHTRNLSFLKRFMNGPYFDLEAIWNEHTYYEFGERSVEKTMATMVQEPYVNHVPTLTGGIGRENLNAFYRDHFIFKNPADTELELISRTVGVDRVIDEFIFRLTHDSEVDWLLPGVPPTGKKLQIPFMAVVNIRGDRLYHEHITWDQATVLRQLDLLPEFLPISDSKIERQASSLNGSFEFQVPVAGVETAQKLRDKNSIPSNQMFQFKVREVQ